MKRILMTLLVLYTCAQSKTENLCFITLDGMRWQEVFGDSLVYIKLDQVTKLKLSYSLPILKQKVNISNRIQIRTVKHLLT